MLPFGGKPVFGQHGKSRSGDLPKRNKSRAGRFDHIRRHMLCDGLGHLAPARVANAKE